MKNKNIFENYYNLWNLFNQTRHAIYRARELELDKSGVSAEHARLLVVVKELGNNATPTEISKHVFRQSHTISSLVDRGVAKGLVKKVMDPNNKKTRIICLTGKGEKILTQVLEINSIYNIFSGLSRDDVAHLDKTLKVLLARAINENGLKYKFDMPEPSKLDYKISNVL